MTRATACALSVVGIAAFGITAAHAEERQVAAQANGYTLYWERPGYCTLYLDTPRRAMVRFSYSVGGTVNFSYVRPDLQRSPGAVSYPVMFQFDDAVNMLAIMAVDTQLDDGRAGFVLAGASLELLDRWARGRTVSLRIESVSASPLETISLKGSIEMIQHLKSCANPQYTVSIPPPPPPDEMSSEPETPFSTQGPQLSIHCPKKKGGQATYRLGDIVIGRGLSCEDGEPSSSGSRDFGAAGSLHFVFKPVSMIFGEGSIVYIPRQGTPRVINIDYMAGFSEAPAVDRVKIAYRGVLDASKGPSDTICEHRIDWQRGEIVASRWVGGYPGTRGNCGNPQ